MNKLIISALFAFIPLLVCSCSDSNSDSPTPVQTGATITTTPQAVNAGFEAFETTITVTSTADWSITPDADWISVTPTGGSKNQPTEVRVKLTANSGATARTATMQVKSGGSSLDIPVTQEARPMLNLSTNKLSFGGQATTATVTIEASTAWTATSDAAWCTVTPAQGEGGSDNVTISATANDGSAERIATVTFLSGELQQELTVSQYTDVITAPEGYTLVWHDEFNSPNGSMVNTQEWYYDDWAPGYVNNELQRYVPGKLGDEYTAIIEDGILNIIARKYNNQVISARINTRELWTYGYFEARLKLPQGKGTWPAFWMMPANGGNWPHCGEIDIMEEVGVNPNYTSSSIHCTSYNHMINTQKTAERYTAGAEEEFHVYALEWTSEYIRTYVDGQPLLYFANDGKGDDNTWPFHVPFHPILNLAWGGDWGGWNGVNESALPATYQIDYVRVFQKK